MDEVITAREIKVLEYDQIRGQLAGLTVSPMGELAARQLIPSADFSTVQQRLKETDEGRLLSSKNAFTPSPVEDIEPQLSRVGKGASLAAGELTLIMTFIRAARHWTEFFKDGDQRELYPLLSTLAGGIDPCHELNAALDRSLDSDGNVLDSASPALSSLRRQKQSLQSKIRDKLDEYLRSSTYRKYMQETLVTIRNGRYVLPVRQEYRQNVKGVVHDQSASGATLFIEPLPVVQMQNELTSLHRREEQEIERILYELSGQVAADADALAVNRSVYTELDFIIARGRLSLAMGASVPRLSEEITAGINFVDAVHPLLPGEKVPLSVKLGAEVQTLIVTGPNTGGKTVALKTIGLLTVMVQSGLHIPAGPETKVSVFEKVRADIGDEQSIAQSLSTFSGHMKNIIEIVENAGPGSMVLFDEVGAGTDPSEGSALAMAVLAELTEKGALTVATTHINELKLFAQARERMQNAAMEFDPDTLTPTYRLLQGVPGQSNAFYIAAQLGLPQKVLENAKTFVHRSHDQVESVIASLVEDQQRFYRDSRQAEIERSRAEILMEELEKERELLRARREDILREAREEARQLIKRSKSTADRVIKELRALKHESGEKPLAGAEQARQELNLLRREIEAGEQTEGDEDETLGAEDLAEGQRVYVRSLKQEGEVISFTSNEALVRVGSMNVHLPLRELRPVRKNETAGKKTGKSPDTASYSVSKDTAVRNSIDLRGLNLDEARPLVDKLLDNALWAGLSRVDLIHGKGTGKLKEGLRAYLAEHPLVGAFRSGGSGEGGEGVTVVELKS